MMKLILKVIFWIIVTVVSVLAFLIIYATISDYKPGKQSVVLESVTPDIYPNWTEIDMLIWNIGYCGLDEKMDFFYDGGKKVRTPREQLLENLRSVISELQSNDTCEFILLQEVDRNSSRSYRINESDSIMKSLPNYQSSFGKNYDVFFVPVPFTDPMGRVESGIQTLSRPVALSSVRWSYPGKFAWPKSLFMLDRCFLVNRYPLKSGNEMLIINTHNSAYDAGGVLRSQEMKYLHDFLISEYEKGNYVVVGGDWNQSPPGFVPEFTGDIFDSEDFTKVPDNYLPEGWKWVFDPMTASNRRVKFPYERGKTTATIIDFFLLSPNVQPVKVNTIDKEFRNSDHQPVRLKLRLL
jgi:endonuclease/exonuclease/phosphatase family metal-dependent hydrolase